MTRPLAKTMWKGMPVRALINAIRRCTGPSVVDDAVAPGAVAAWDTAAEGGAEAGEAETGDAGDKGADGVTALAAAVPKAGPGEDCGWTRSSFIAFLLSP